MRLAALWLAAALASGGWLVLQSRQNNHATLVYVCLLYLAVLPLLALYWRTARAADSRGVRFPNLAWAAGAVLFLVALGVSIAIGHGRMISDESAYRFQARIFAAGKLKAEPMPGAAENPAEVPTEIYFEHTQQTPNGWYAKYPLGWPLILAIGFRLRCPWLLNPAFGVVQLVMMWRVAKRWGWNTQVLAVVMAATSAYMVANNAGYMSHACEALLTLAALELVLRGTRTRRLWLIAGAFAAATVAIAVRPFTGAVVALLLTAIVGIELRRERRLLIPALGIAALAGCVSIAVFLLANHLYTGHALLSPYALLRGGTRIGELTLNPARLVANMLSIWRWSITGTLCFTFPFMFLFAAYAWPAGAGASAGIAVSGEPVSTTRGSVFFPKRRVREHDRRTVLLRRFLSAGDCRGPRVRSAVHALAHPLAGGRRGGGGSDRLAVRDPGLRLAPGCGSDPSINEAWSLADSAPREPLVFLSGNSDTSTAKHVNWNAVDWGDAPVIYLNDPGAGQRDAAACRLDRPSYRVVSWDAPRRQMEKSDATASCGP
ncbi:MAG: hypothetical protein ABSH50_24620 [Bryobacteraceae bacterium]